MSHGPASDEIKAEPNLIPLLDLVFQLIMFFMICVNFVSEQVSSEILLPTSQSARPMDKSEVDVLFLNLKSNGAVIAPGQERPLLGQVAIQYYLRQQFADARELAIIRGDKKGQVRTAVIIRADQDATFGHVFNLLRWCKEVGYRKLQLRAFSVAGSK